MFILCVFILILSLTYILINSLKSNYWKNKGIKYVKPLPIVGNTLPMIMKTETLPELILRLYNAFPNERYCGVFQLTQPIFLVRDPDLIKRIMIKDFDTFPNHPQIFSQDADPLWAKNLLASEGQRWKNLRQTLSPAFSSNKMKSMFFLMEECTKKFLNYLSERNEDILEIELNEVFKLHTLDVIATTAFGIECNSLTNRNNKFLRMGKEIVDFSGLKKFKLFLHNFNPVVAKLLGIKIFSDDVSNFFRSVMKDTIETRTRKNIVRPDLVQLLMEARKGKLKSDNSVDELDSFATVKESNLGAVNKDFALELTDDDITSQALVFFFGGFDTTSSLINFCIYELVANPDVQEVLRTEIDENLKKFDGRINYEGLFKMKYLDMVISETLRKWPPPVFHHRKSQKPFTVEPEREDEIPLHLEAGTICWIPAYGIQRDPKYWPDPDKFIPERFNDENRTKINPFTYLPFGMGPRSCIASRFALMEAKLLIFYLLALFTIVPINKTRIPLVVDPNNLLMLPKHGFWFGFKKRNN